MTALITGASTGIGAADMARIYLQPSSWIMILFLWQESRDKLLKLKKLLPL
ncbi:hypothetical protein [Ruminococcus sp. HUN007]|uniref:hypothetical protein n=1 Tax=Ruminococcus sp. HUN007 TaxID=1514668 RepID=UPI0012DF9E75|nr:hypothetical protein [Ruminococcus sp. HUN007]